MTTSFLFFTQEFQREEMYCRNKTARYSKSLLSRDCFALQWFEDKLGCHEVEDEGALVIQCVCATDFCNGDHVVKTSGGAGLTLNRPFAVLASLAMAIVRG